MGIKDLFYLGIIVVVAAGIGFAGGFYFGRKKIDTVTKTEYIKQEPITENIGSDVITPVKVEIPTQPLYPVKYDTIFKLMVVDTAAIIADYIAKKYYDITAFDNKELGTLKLLPTLQYNSLSELKYEFTPIQIRQTIYREKAFVPFISASYSTFGYVGIGGGVFYHNIGLEYLYIMDMNKIMDGILLGNNRSGHQLSLKYKF